MRIAMLQAIDLRGGAQAIRKAGINCNGDDREVQGRSKALGQSNQPLQVGRAGLGVIVAPPECRCFPLRGPSFEFYV